MSALDESPAAEGRYRVLFDALPIAGYQTGPDSSRQRSFTSTQLPSGPVW